MDKVRRLIGRRKGGEVNVHCVLRPELPPSLPNVAIVFVYVS